MIYYINAFSQPGDPGGDPDVPIFRYWITSRGSVFWYHEANDLKKR